MGFEPIQLSYWFNESMRQQNREALLLFVPYLDSTTVMFYINYISFLKDVKFASVIKKLWFYTHTDVYTQYFYESVNTNHRHITLVGFEPTTMALLEHQRASPVYIVLTPK